MPLDSTPRGYRFPDGDERASIDIIVGRLAGDIDADVSKVEGRSKPLRASVLASNSGAINPSTSINLGLVTFPTTRIRVVLSGIVTATAANNLFVVTLRDGSAAGTTLAQLQTRPSAAGGAGEETSTAIGYADVTPGERSLFLAAQRTDGTGSGNLKTGFTVEVQAVNV